MAVINALKKVPGLLGSHPILFVPILLLYIVTTAQTVTQSVLPPLAGGVVALVISGLLFLLTPLYQGGTIGMANEAADSSRTSLGSFVRYGKQYYLSILGAFLLILAMMTALGIVALLLAVVVFLSYSATGQSLAVLVIGGVAGLVVFGLYVTVSVFLQFHGHAIVIEDLGAVDGLKRSAEVVTENIRAVVGFFVVTLSGALVFAGLYVGALWLSPVPFLTDPAATVSLELALLEALLSILFLWPVGAVYLVYSVLFYRSLIATDGESTAPPAEPAEGSAGSSI
jgi:hypothetical protein